jgi:hypothetical protein
MTEVQTDIAERLLPHFVIPPLGEPDPEKQRSLTIGELVPDSGYRVGRYCRFGLASSTLAFCFPRWGMRSRESGFRLFI